MNDEVGVTLKGLLRNLQQVRAQREKAPSGQTATAAAQRAGEIWGLDTAIAAIKRRMP